MATQLLKLEGTYTSSDAQEETVSETLGNGRAVGAAIDAFLREGGTNINLNVSSVDPQVE